MQKESKIPMECEAQCNQENISSAMPPTQRNVTALQPAKKPTRQWAAWTRQEEENFFAALRQVGKNFEKITCRVQSKNKDQVRHYYYRLVRRMNKLLGPELSLDAKNSKDTNAAMLRWWSLLEKYSCRASKLHLKPRRFKLFIEALESQLLKDRKKSMRKRISQGEYYPPASNAVSFHDKAAGPENPEVNLIFVDSQSIQKMGPGKGPLKRSVSVGLNRNNTRDTTAIKTPRQQRNSGVASSAAYKKWEKAAIAGVSLVADAAEQLERTATEKDIDNGQSASGQKNFDPTRKVPNHFPDNLQNLVFENNNQTSRKLKLQLFPIDDSTRRALEMDNHNPHLELILSARKKISSVVEHCNRKWGNTNVASGQLMLFPFGAQRNNVADYQRWSQESVVTAADVYGMIGSPPVFRLRYGWFSNEELGSGILRASVASPCTSIAHNTDMEKRKGHSVSLPASVSSINGNSQSSANHFKNQSPSVCQSHAHASSSVHQPSEMSTPAAASNEFVEPPDPAADMLWDKQTSDHSGMQQIEDVADQRLIDNAALLAGEWADGLVSVGDLLAEVPQDMNADCLNSPVAEGAQCFEQTPFSCDSFDAAIAAHLSKQNRSGLQSCFSSHASTIYDAEETCDAFSFQKNRALKNELSRLSVSAVSGASDKDSETGAVFSGLDEVRTPQGNGSKDSQLHDDPMDECPSNQHFIDNPGKDFNSLADISWPDSLGPLDLDIPSSRYRSEDMILGDSLGGLNNLIASSVDALQNCSLFGSDRKEVAPTHETRESASISGLKIDSQG